MKPERRKGPLLARLKERWREGIRHRVTALGAMMLALLFTSGLLAFTTTQNVFFLLFSLLIASILISSFVNRLMLAGLELRLELPSHAMAGEAVPCTLVVNNQKSWVPSFALELIAPVGRHFYLPMVPSGGKASLSVDVVWSHRGVPDPVVVELSTRFPFGFSVRRTRLAIAVQQALYPSIREQDGFREVLGQIEATAAQLRRGDDPEFSHLREYRSGDDWRRIAWRKPIASGQWMIKEHSVSGAGELRLGLSTNEANVERSIELAAYIIWELQHRKVAFDFELASQIIHVADLESAYALLAILALVAPETVLKQALSRGTFTISIPNANI